MPTSGGRRFLMDFKSALLFVAIMLFLEISVAFFVCTAFNQGIF